MTARPPAPRRSREDAPRHVAIAERGVRGHAARIGRAHRRSRAAPVTPLEVPTMPTPTLVLHESPVGAPAAAVRPAYAAPGGGRLVRAGALTAVVDGLFSSVLAAGVYGVPAERVWRGVAATVLGPAAVADGAGPVLLGLALHVAVALAWAALFFLLVRRRPDVRARVATRRGLVGAAALYGPAVWLVMSLVVVPLLVGRAPVISARWWVQLAGHVAFVGLPIVWGVAWRLPRLAPGERAP